MSPRNPLKPLVFPMARNTLKEEPSTTTITSGVTEQPVSFSTNAPSATEQDILNKSVRQGTVVETSQQLAQSLHSQL